MLVERFVLTEIKTIIIIIICRLSPLFLTTHGKIVLHTSVYWRGAEGTML